MLFENDIILQFKIPEVYGGLAEARGILRFDETDLIIELETIDLAIGLFKSDVKVFRIELTSIHKVEYHKGYFSKKIEILPISMKQLEKFPGRKGNSIKLNINRKNGGLANEFVTRLNLAINNRKLELFD